MKFPVHSRDLPDSLGSKSFRELAEGRPCLLLFPVSAVAGAGGAKCLSLTSDDRRNPARPPFNDLGSQMQICG